MAGGCNIASLKCNFPVIPLKRLENDADMLDMNYLCNIKMVEDSARLPYH